MEGGGIGRPSFSWHSAHQLSSTGKGAPRLAPGARHTPRGALGSGALMHAAPLRASPVPSSPVRRGRERSKAGAPPEGGGTLQKKRKPPIVPPEGAIGGDGWC